MLVCSWTWFELAAGWQSVATGSFWSLSQCFTESVGLNATTCSSKQQEYFYAYSCTALAVHTFTHCIYVRICISLITCNVQAPGVYAKALNAAKREAQTALQETTEVLAPHAKPAHVATYTLLWRVHAPWHKLQHLHICNHVWLL